MFRPVSTALEIQGFLHAHIDISLILTRQSVGIIEIYMSDFIFDAGLFYGLKFLFLVLCIVVGCCW